MAGFVKSKQRDHFDAPVWVVFHIDEAGVATHIRQYTNMSSVITLQLDGDELDAALWGLENYKKGHHEVP